MTIKGISIWILNISVVIFWGLAIFGCSNSEPMKSKKSEGKDFQVDNTHSESPSIAGKSYSDSIINKLVKDQMPKQSYPIDTFSILHNIECSHHIDFNEYQFNLDSLRKYQNKKPFANPELKQLTGASNCLFKYYSTSKFDAYIFYSDIVESHSSQSFFILAIDKNSNSFEKLNLSQEYGNESGDYVMTAVLRKDLIIERQINHNVRYIHGTGNVDSIYRERQEYLLTNTGKFKRISQEIEPSTERNKIFEGR